MPAERIYSVSQLTEALQSGVVGLKDQLQVLSILDGTATHWPGVSAAQEDLEQLVKLAGQQLASLEGQVQQLNNAKTRLQEQNVQLTSRLKASETAKQQLQDEIREHTQANKQLQSTLAAQQAATQQAQQQVRQLEQANVQLAHQATKQAEEAEFLEGELSGLREHEMHLREQVAAQQEKLSGLSQELAVKSTELSHVISSLQEHRDSLAHTRSQLVSVQDSLGGQLKALQRQLAGTQADKLVADREVGALTEQVSTLAANLSKAEAEAQRLREWQDVSKRMADDKQQEVAKELQASKSQAAEQQAAAAGELSALQERLAARDSQLKSLQQETSLLQMHLREAQRVQGAAAEAQAAANTALDRQDAELRVLQQQLKDAKVDLERARADRLAAEAAAQQAAAADRSQLSSQLEQAEREVAVKQALCDSWQRAHQAIQDRIKQLEAAAAAAAAAADARMSDLRIELEAERAEARRAKMEAASTAKQFEQLVQRLRREADASAEEVCRLRSLQATMVARAGAGSGSSMYDDPAGLQDMPVPPQLQQELMQLHRAMHTISGNLQAAEATMQQMAATSMQPQPAAGGEAAADAGAVQDNRQGVQNQVAQETQRQRPMMQSRTAAASTASAAGRGQAAKKSPGKAPTNKPAARV